MTTQAQRRTLAATTNDADTFEMPLPGGGSAAAPGSDTLIRLLPLPPQQRQQMEGRSAATATGPDVRALADFFDRTYRSYCQSVLWGIFVSLLTAGPLLFWCGTLAEAAAGTGAEGAFWFASILLALCIGSCIRLFSIPPVLRRAADLLIAADSVHAVGPLLDIFYSGGASLRDDAAKVPLVRNLRRLSGEMSACEAADILKEPYRQVLRQTLTASLNGYSGGLEERFKYDPAYLRAALDVIAHIGDTASAPEVERLAEESRDPEVRDAARDCLRHLRVWD